MVGDVCGNAARICDELDKNSPLGVDLLVFSELFLQGYPPRDLLERKWFVDNSLHAIDDICRYSAKYPQTGILLGTILPNSVPYGKGLSNAAVLIQNGRIIFRQNKSLLPSYDVFDETRYFDPSPEISTFLFKGEMLGISICEDAWNDAAFWSQRLYGLDPLAELAFLGTTLFINISASPFHLRKENLRFKLLKNHAVKHHVPLLFVNQTGGNDELIFDGNSVFLDEDGNIREMLPGFEECVRIIDTLNPGVCLPVPEPDQAGSVHDALILGLKDYVRKCGFKSVLLGLSGGIDSAVTCALACRAVGSENVWGITMPSRHSSEGSFKDSEILSHNLGIKFIQIPIEGAFSAFLDSLNPIFTGTESGLAEENLQARIRGTF